MADAINLTSILTPVSATLTAGCFAVLGLALVLIALELRPQTPRPRPRLRPRLRLRLVALLTALILIGGLVETLADLRLDAISVIFGLEGPGSPDLYGSWLQTEQAGQAMTIAGVVGLAIIAAVAIARLRDRPHALEIDTK